MASTPPGAKNSISIVSGSSPARVTCSPPASRADLISWRFIDDAATRRSVMWTPVAFRPAIIARLIMRAAGWASREAAARSPRSSERTEGQAQPHRHLGRHVHVDDALDAVAGEQRRDAPRLPDQVLVDVRARLDRLERVHAHVGRDRRLLADRALVADGHAGVDAGVRADVAVAPDDGARDHGAAADVGAAVDHGALDGRALLDRDVGAEHRVRADVRPLLDLAVVAQVRRPLDHVHRRQGDAVAEPDVGLEPDPGTDTSQRPSSTSWLASAVLVEVPDVEPVPSSGRT